MIKEGNLYYTHKTKTGEIDVLVTDVPYEYCDGYYQDPDEQLCEEYSIPYDLVNCIELAWCGGSNPSQCLGFRA